MGLVDVTLALAVRIPVLRASDKNRWLKGAETVILPFDDYSRGTVDHVTLTEQRLRCQTNSPDDDVHDNPLSHLPINNAFISSSVPR